MIKRLLIALILFSMVLHSASRLGILSYLYQQRHQVAYTLGMIVEVPIAMCNSDYDFSNTLHIQADDASDSTLPPTLITASEIHLFFTGFTHITINNNPLIASVDNPSKVIDRRYSSPALSIFHPPS